MKKYVSWILAIVVACMTAACLPDQSLVAQAAGKPVVVVLDPGHGGGLQEDLGALHAPYAEKAMNMYVALLTKAELEQYDNVKVYLTRTDDYYVSLAQRVEYAHSLNADLFACLHFNVSNRQKSGAEVYVSVDPLMQQQEGPFAQTVLAALGSQGLNVRGIYARGGLNGDYYGILRRATAYGMPAAIIEHCYVDNATDRLFLSAPDAYARMAHADAMAIAQYFHLKSRSLGTDFSGYQRPGYSVIPMGNSGASGKAPVYNGPQISNIGQCISLGGGQAQLTLYCVDTASPVNAFTYSTDGGVTFSAPIAYGNPNGVYVVNIAASRGQTIVIRAYNQKGQYKLSNSVVVQ